MSLGGEVCDVYPRNGPPVGRCILTVSVPVHRVV